MSSIFKKIFNLNFLNWNQKNVDQLESNASSTSNNYLRRSVFQDDQRINEFILIWLDQSSQENSLHSLYTRTLLKKINNEQCLFFAAIDLFLSKIEELQNENKKTLVVLSGSFAKHVLDKTKHLSTIIIFCRNDEQHKHLLQLYSNVAAVCTDYETLKNSIERELSSLKFNLFSDRKFSSFRPLTLSEDIEHNGAYFSYMLFIDLLKRMPQTKQAKEDMLDKCKDFYRTVPIELKRIEYFQKSYTSNEAIKWYVRDSFVYRLVNRAFRTEDVELWYTFRYFITNLCTQLEEIHKDQNNKTSFTLYRGQGHLPIKELESIQSNIGGLISTNGFFSTSKDYDIARSFLLTYQDSSEFKVAFFQINVDASRLKNIIFVDIDDYTRVAYEDEVLFHLGSVFVIEC